MVLPRKLSVKQEEESFISESLNLLSEEENALIINTISTKEPEKEELLFALELYLSEGNHFTVENLSFQLFSEKAYYF